MSLQKLLPENVLTGFSSVPKKLGSLPGMSLSAVATAIKEKHPGILAVICADAFDARALSSELFALSPTTPCRYFPDWETLPYDQLSPHQDIVSNRLQLLADLPYMTEGVVITPLSAVMSRLPPLNFIGAQALHLKRGDHRDILKMQQTLTSQGYLKVAQVLSHGEFAARGSILDLFPMGSDTPFRIDFLDDEVDSIREFDLETQRSLGERSEINLLPAHEFPLDDKGVSVFRSNYRNAFPNAQLTQHPVYQAISRGAVPSGIEYYLPLFFALMNSFFEYFAVWGGSCL